MGRLKLIVTMVSVGTSLALLLGRLRRIAGGGAVLKRAMLGAASGWPALVLACVATLTV